jgi:hypothetical protein
MLRSAGRSGIAFGNWKANRPSRQSRATLRVAISLARGSAVDNAAWMASPKVG